MRTLISKFLSLIGFLKFNVTNGISSNSTIDLYWDSPVGCSYQLFDNNDTKDIII